MYDRAHSSVLPCFAVIAVCLLTVLKPCSGIPYQDRCPPNEVYTVCTNPCNDCVQRGQCYMYSCRPGCDCKQGFFRNAYGQCVAERDCLGVTCPPHEEYKSCVSPCNDCEHKGKCQYFQCNPGCDCINGYFRDEFGVCIREDMCLKNGYRCPFPNQEYYPCVPTCHDTCENYHSTKPCTSECRPGCACRIGFVKNHYGECVHPSECQKNACGKNEEFKQCVNLCNTCESRGKCQYYSCEAGGCDCKAGYLRNDSGVCIPEDKCSMQPVNLCKEDEQFYECIPDCKNTCANYFNASAVCPTTCKQGCFCREGLLKNHQGQCVYPDQCEFVTCKTDESFWPCMPLCESVCSAIQRQHCSYTCQPGCFCRAGLYRRDDGACVDYDHCSTPGYVNAVKHYPETCKENEEYYECMPYCKNTCEHWKRPDSYCPEDCRPGCFCKKGLLENRDGQCVKVEECDYYNLYHFGRSSGDIGIIPETPKLGSNASDIPSNDIPIIITNKTNDLDDLSTLLGKSLVNDIGKAVGAGEDSRGVRAPDIKKVATADPLKIKGAASAVQNVKPVVESISKTENDVALPASHTDDANILLAMNNLIKFIEDNFPNANLSAIEGVPDQGILKDSHDSNVTAETAENSTLPVTPSNDTAAQISNLAPNSTGTNTLDVSNASTSNETKTNSSTSIFQRSFGDGLTNIFSSIVKELTPGPSKKPLPGPAGAVLNGSLPAVPGLPDFAATDLNLKEKRTILEKLGVLPILNNVLSVIEKLVNFLLPKSIKDKTSEAIGGSTLLGQLPTPALPLDGKLPLQTGILGRNLGQDKSTSEPSQFQTPKNAAGVTGSPENRPMISTTTVPNSPSISSTGESGNSSSISAPSLAEKPVTSSDLSPENSDSMEPSPETSSETTLSTTEERISNKEPSQSLTDDVITDSELESAAETSTISASKKPSSINSNSPLSDVKDEASPPILSDDSSDEDSDLGSPEKLEGTLTTLDGIKPNKETSVTSSPSSVVSNTEEETSDEESQSRTTAESISESTVPDDSLEYYDDSDPIVSNMDDEELDKKPSETDDEHANPVQEIISSVSSTEKSPKQGDKIK